MASSCSVASRSVGFTSGFNISPFRDESEERTHLRYFTLPAVEACGPVLLVSASSSAKYTFVRKKRRNSSGPFAALQCSSRVFGRSVILWRAEFYGIGSGFREKLERRASNEQLLLRRCLEEAEGIVSTLAFAANLPSSLDNNIPNFTSHERDLLTCVEDEGNRDNIGIFSATESRKDSRKKHHEFIGVHPFRGRFEVKVQKDHRAKSLRFSSQEDAARAYDKAMYKLHGDDAQTNFSLTKEEKLQIKRMEWDDLLVHLQLQDPAKTSPSRLGFPGVYYKEGTQSWMAKIRRENENYVGYFPSMVEAIRAYDLAAYKLQGQDALLSCPLSSAEKVQIMHKDWDSFAAKFGFNVHPRRRKRMTECRGVRLRPSGNFLASFAHKGSYFYLGTFDTKETAAKAYDLFAYKLLGDDAQLNSELLQEEKEFLKTMSIFSLRNHLASQADIAPKILPLGARGARLVQGRWEVCLENVKKDRLYTFSASSEQEAVKVHDKAVYKLHNGMGRAYADLTLAEQAEVESLDWSNFMSKFNLQQTPSYHGVNRLVSGLWQSYVRHGGAYLAIATFDSPDAAARASDMCEYKLRSGNAILNFPLSEQQKREADGFDWGTLVANIRAEQIQSPVTNELGHASEVSSPSVPREKKSMLLLCQEQLLQQQMARRAPKIGRQLVIANPALAAQFSHYNRRADESPMLVEEIMEGSNAALLWQCPCGNLVLKPPIRLLRATQVVCKLPECTAKILIPRRMPRRLN